MWCFRFLTNNLGIRYEETVVILISIKATALCYRSGARLFLESETKQPTKPKGIYKAALFSTACSIHVHTV